MAVVYDVFQNHITLRHAPHTPNLLQAHANFAGTYSMHQTNAFSTTRTGNHAHPLLVDQRPDYQALPVINWRHISQKCIVLSS